MFYLLFISLFRDQFHQPFDTKAPHRVLMKLNPTHTLRKVLLGGPFYEKNCKKSTQISKCLDLCMCCLNKQSDIDFHECNLCFCKKTADR
jgi:hypothetical protein